MMTVDNAIVQTGHNLRQVRISKGLSVQTLALLSHIDEQQILDIESGKGGECPVETILLLADELNTNVRQIMAERKY